MNLPDLDTPTHIDMFVHSFYNKLLNDELMAPVFLTHANIDILAHLPTISLYWQKMLWGDRQYDNHTMNIHRSVHANHPFEAQHFHRWFYYFEQTAAESFSGTFTDRALDIAQKVITNMKKQMLTPSQTAHQKNNS